MRRKTRLCSLLAPPGRRRAPAAPAFDPAALGGLSVWLKADALTAADGAPVPVWADASGQAHTATAGPTPPIFRQAALFGRPGVAFVNGYAKTAPFAAPLAQPLTVYTVAASVAMGGTQVLLDGLSAGYSVHPYTDGVNWLVDAGGNAPAFPSGLPLAAHRMAVVLNGAASLAYRNGVTSGPFNPGPHGLDGLVLGTYFGLNAVFWNGLIHEVLVYQGAHTPAQVGQVDAYLKSKWFGDTKPQVVCKGDSLTFGFSLANPATQSYPGQMAAALGPGWDVTNLGTSGERADTMVAAAPTEVGLCFRDTRPKNIAVLWAGVNDLFQGADAPTTYARVVALGQAIRASGFKVIALTLPPSNFTNGTPANYEASRQTVNSNIRAHYATFADALADVGGDPNIGNPANTGANTSDGLHLNQAGYAIVNSCVLPAVHAL